MSYSLGDLAKDYLQKKVEYATEEVESTRLNICNSCPHKNIMGVCNKCGCLIKAKIKYKKSSCPIGKW